jgi:hypothetical protein
MVSGRARIVSRHGGLFRGRLGGETIGAFTPAAAYF